MIRLKQLLHEWTGETWNAYTDWKSHKNNLLTTTILAPEFMSGPAIEVNASNSAFTITYQGPASGVHVAHANGSSGDTLHQLFNVIIFELNPYLANKKLKPNLRSITTKCTKSKRVKNTYTLTIRIPLNKSNTAWQINHRGGWGGMIRGKTPLSIIHLHGLSPQMYTPKLLRYRKVKTSQHILPRILWISRECRPERTHTVRRAY